MPSFDLPLGFPGVENAAAPMAVALQLGNKVVAMASEGTKLCFYADGQLLPQEPGLADGFSGSFALLHRGSEEAWGQGGWSRENLSWES